MSMLPGLPLLTADDHEFVVTLVTDGNAACWPPSGSGWALIGFGASNDCDSYLWARRKDGCPLDSSPRDYPRKQPPRRCEDD
jgi:hypothetical protein